MAPLWEQKRLATNSLSCSFPRSSGGVRLLTSNLPGLPGHSESKGNGKTAIKCTRAAREKEGKDENGPPDAVQPGGERSLGVGEVRMKQKRQFYQQDEWGEKNHLQPANV